MPIFLLFTILFCFEASCLHGSAAAFTFGWYSKSSFSAHIWRRSSTFAALIGNHFRLTHTCLLLQLINANDSPKHMHMHEYMHALKCNGTQTDLVSILPDPLSQMPLLTASALSRTLASFRAAHTAACASAHWPAWSLHRWLRTHSTIGAVDKSDSPRL